MTATIELPEYERYQNYLPELDVAVNIVLSKLAIVYQHFIETDGSSHSGGIIKVWIKSIDSGIGSSDKLLGCYDSLRDIIDEMFSETGVSYSNEAFLAMVQEECDDYGYEDSPYENPDEIFVEEVYAVRLALLNEMQDFLDTYELSVRIAV